ncbi:MAG: carbohydrate-binding protein [Bacteroidia bacterium]|nr:carbohydrate-binding protein [Bacteroidia bacterium]
MKKCLMLITYGLLLAACCCSLQAQTGYLHASGTEIVDGNGDTILLRGMGLGGWMLQEGYMMGTASVANTQHALRARLSALIGATNTEAFYEAWRANHVSKRDIDSLAAWGFNSIRLPMHYNLFTLPIQQEPVAGQNTWLDTGFRLTDSLLSWCAQNHMYLILDLHAAPGGQGMDAAISDYDNTLPSLWESQANRDKTVALWARIANRYKNEPWIGGYDLINEVNWNLPGNTALRNLYGQITQAIRQVDQNHLIFIEGNWFANDFTGLTPPWDNNMAYSFHRYWAYNTQSTIQGYLDMRQTYQVPLWMGEAGENSNVWFRDCITLLEKNNIGWAWWPMKKIDNISGPYSINKAAGYQAIIDYWGGQGPQPSFTAATQTMMQIAENAKIQNCLLRRDVVDSWFNQVRTDTVRPFITQSIPGVVYAVDYDLGNNGAAYKDAVVANYQVSSGTFTAWNTGYSYRNDGVDIEATQDAMNARGYNVGWIENDEWLQYDVLVATTGAYQVQYRAASNQASGIVSLKLDGADISQPLSLGNTGGWQNWQNINQSGIILTEGRHKLRVQVRQGGFNLSSLGFVLSGTTASVPASFLSGVTADAYQVDLNLNKPMAAPPAAPGGFRLYVGGTEIPVTQVQLHPTDTRLVRLTTSYELEAGDVITASYAGSAVLAADGTALQAFTQQPVSNTLRTNLIIPGKIQAEAYYFQDGIQLENASDVGGGQNIGYCDPGDYWLYQVRVQQQGIYQVTYRVASQATTGKMVLQILDEATQAYVSLDTLVIPNTGGWQFWTSISRPVSLPAGEHTLRCLVIGSQFNLNWLDFTFVTALEDQWAAHGISLAPNPTAGSVWLRFETVDGRPVQAALMNLAGQTLMRRAWQVREAETAWDLSGLPAGVYMLQVRGEGGILFVQKIVLQP